MHHISQITYNQHIQIMYIYIYISIWIQTLDAQMEFGSPIRIPDPKSQSQQA